jgi:hypothetical protein
VGEWVGRGWVVLIRELAAAPDLPKYYRIWTVIGGQGVICVARGRSRIIGACRHGISLDMILTWGSGDTEIGGVEIFVRSKSI